MINSERVVETMELIITNSEKTRTLRRNTINRMYPFASEGVAVIQAKKWKTMAPLELGK